MQLSTSTREGSQMTVDIIQKIHSIAFQANDFFAKCHEQSLTTMAIIGNAVIVDCALSNRRLALMTLDQYPGIVGAAVGVLGDDKSEPVGEFPVESLTASQVLNIMEKHFMRQPA